MKKTVPLVMPIQLDIQLDIQQSVISAKWGLSHACKQKVRDGHPANVQHPFFYVHPPILCSQINLLDSRRSLNINIFLKQFRTSNDVIIRLIADGRSNEIGAEKLKSLLKILPENDEVVRFLKSQFIPVSNHIDMNVDIKVLLKM